MVDEAVNACPERSVPLKRWYLDEAERCGVGYNAITMRVHRGKYPGLKVRSLNSRVKFVILSNVPAQRPPGTDV